jgi:hypothetical protein
MENNYEIILTDFATGEVQLSKQAELNNLFNFELLKEVLTTIIKNQINLKKQFEEKSLKQNKLLDTLNNKFIEFNQKEILNFSPQEFIKLKERINKLEIKIEQINDELDKSK